MISLLPLNRTTNLVAVTSSLLSLPLDWTNEILSPLSLSLSLSLKCLVWGRLIILFCFLFLWIYILEFSIIIFVWKLGKCEKLVENMFSRAFLRTQPNTWKKIFKHFSKCNEIPKNILYSENILCQAYHILNLIFSQFWLCVCVCVTYLALKKRKKRKKEKKSRRHTCQ